MSSGKRDGESPANFDRRRLRKIASQSSPDASPQSQLGLDATSPKREAVALQVGSTSTDSPLAAPSGDGSMKNKSGDDLNWASIDWDKSEAATSGDDLIWASIDWDNCPIFVQRTQIFIPGFPVCEGPQIFPLVRPSTGPLWKYSEPSYLVLSPGQRLDSNGLPFPLNMDDPRLSDIRRKMPALYPNCIKTAFGGKFFQPLKEQDCKCAEIAIKFYNDKHATDYEIVATLGSYRKLEVGFWFHCNFLAKLSNTTGSPPNLFFAELQRRSGNPETKVCMMLDAPRRRCLEVVGGCEMCGEQILHPVNKFTFGEKGKRVRHRGKRVLKHDIRELM